MSKIDEVLQEIENRQKNTYTYGAQMTLEFCEDLVEQLRPYMELAELMVEYYNESFYDDAKEEKVQTLINQIKEDL